MTEREKNEFEYLKWFRINCYFGPAHEDVVMIMDEQYEADTGNKVPSNWRSEDEEA
jgi:hypothetical protein